MIEFNDHLFVGISALGNCFERLGKFVVMKFVVIKKVNDHHCGLKVFVHDRGFGRPFRGSLSFLGPTVGERGLGKEVPQDASVFERDGFVAFVVDVDAEPVLVAEVDVKEASKALTLVHQVQRTKVASFRHADVVVDAVLASSSTRIGVKGGFGVFADDGKLGTQAFFASYNVLVRRAAAFGDGVDRLFGDGGRKRFLCVAPAFDHQKVSIGVEHGGIV